MPVVKPIQTNFATGEIAAYLQGRIDYDKYRGGAKTITNGYVTVAGSVVKRKGTVYVGAAKTAGERIRLIPLIYDSDDFVILEFGDGYIRFWDKSGQILSGASPLELASPYQNDVTTQDLDEIQYWPSYDVLYMTHPRYAPRKLTRTSATTFTIEVLGIYDGPYLPMTYSGATMTPSHTSGTSRTLTASSATFAATWVGKIIAIKQPYSPNFLTVTAENQQQAAHVVYGEFTIDITSIPTSPFVGKLTLQKSYDSGTTWEDVGIYYGATLQTLFEPQMGVVYRFNCKTGHFTSGSAICAIDQSEYWAVCYITGYTSTTVVTVDIKQVFMSTDASKFWKEGAWGDNRGWPVTSCLFNDRLVFGGTSYQPKTIWGSWIGDYTTFIPGDTSEESSFDFTLGRIQDPIQWLFPWKTLVLGTLTEEVTLTPPAGKSISPVTPPNVELQTNYGSAYSFRPVLADKSLLTVPLNRKKIREFTYSFADDSYVAPDLTQLAKHIGDQKIREIAYAREPYASLYCVLDNGRMGVLSYNRYEKVVAWSQFTTHAQLAAGTSEDEFLSVCAVPMPDTWSDAEWVYVAVRRVVNLSYVTYIERFAVNDQAYTSSNPHISTSYGIWEKYYLLDCCMQFNNPSNAAMVALTGFTHLNGNYVMVIGYGDSDTYDYSPPTIIGGFHLVTAGTVPLGGSYTNTRFLIGTPYTLELETLNLETAGEGVIGQGSIKRIIDVKVRCTKTAGELQYGKDIASATKIVAIPAEANDWEDIYDIPILWKSGWDEKGRICLRHENPLDCHILSLIYTAEVNP